MYKPSPFTGESTPENLSRYLQQELIAISREMQETQELELRTRHVEPANPREGMIIQADGTDWDPGSGAGAYIYQGGGWVWLGLQASDIDTSGFVEKAQNGSDFANIATTRQNLGLEIGVDVMAFDGQLFSVLPVTTIVANTTLALTDRATALLMQGSTAAQAITIPAFATVAFPQGTTVTIENYSSVNWNLTPAGGVSLFWGVPIVSGGRVLASGAVVTLHNLFTDQWLVAGSGIS